MHTVINAKRNDCFGLRLKSSTTITTTAEKTRREKRQKYDEKWSNFESSLKMARDTFARGAASSRSPAIMRMNLRKRNLSEPTLALSYLIGH